MFSILKKISSFFLTQRDPSLTIDEVSVYKGRWMKGHGCALPPWGILVGPDAHTDLIRHEFGHILQYRQRGFLRFYFQIGIPSIINLYLLKLEKYFTGKNQFIKPHSELDVEKEAEELAFRYFNR